MACDTWKSQLDAYVDGELVPAEAANVGAHLRNCAACAADALDRVQMKRSVAIAGKRYEPSAELRARITKIAAAKPSKTNRWLVRMLVAPAILVLLLSLAVDLYVNRQSARRQRVYSEIADMHVTALASGTPVDVLSSDRHTVKPWFQGKIPFAFNLPELQGSDFTLVGGRVTYLAQAPGAHLIFQLRKHEISVFIFQDRGQETSIPSSQPTQPESFTVESWTKNGLRYFVVGDVSADDIDALSKRLKDAN
jgi:anti-sigma factor RsiW